MKQNHLFKRISAAILSACLAAAAFTGCSGGTAAEPTVSTTATSSDVLRVAMFWVSTTLDPADGYNGWVLSRIGAGETLVRLDENAELTGCIAESWEQPDENTWVFQIREGVTFSNGTPVDAAACKAAIERAFAENTRAEEYFVPASIEADGMTLTIRTETPTGALAHNLAEPLFTIVDTSVDEETMDTAPVTTGPYQVAEFTSEMSVELVRNDSYWDGIPGVSGVSVYSVPDSESRVLAMQAGEADLTTTIDNTSLQLFADESQYTVYEALTPRVNVVYYNNGSDLLSDIRMRQAVSYAADKDTYASLIGCAPATGLYSTALACGQDVADAYPHDPEAAAEILDSLGYLDTDGDGIREKDGENIVFRYVIAADHGSSDSALIAQALQADLQEVGLGCELIQTENMADIRAAGEYDFCSANDSTAPTADPEVFLFQHYYTGGSSNYQNYSNPAVDSLIDTLAATFDPDERQSVAREASEQILQDAGSLYVGYIYGNTVVGSRVQGAKQFPIDYYIVTKDITLS